MKPKTSGVLPTRWKSAWKVERGASVGYLASRSGRCEAFGSGRVVSDRLRRFEDWVGTRDVGVRRVEVTRVASELLALAGAEALREPHVEALVIRYKQGLAGA
jgi:hypothetical protein